MKKIVNDDHTTIVKFLNLLGDHLTLQNIPVDTSSLDISIGSTPSVFSHEKLDIPNKVELHPGNYVFYDRQQQYTGVCKSEDSIAGLVISRVIGHYPGGDRNSIMIDAGATALTKETTPQGDMASVYGRPELECYRMSQEITMIRCRDGSPFPFDDFPLGSTLLLLPNHSCLAAACFEVFHVVDEEAGQLSTYSEIVDKWKPVKGWT